MGKEEWWKHPWCDHILRPEPQNDWHYNSYSKERGRVVDHHEMFCCLCGKPRPKEDELEELILNHAAYGNPGLAKEIRAFIRGKIDGITLTVDKRIEISKALGL